MKLALEGYAGWVSDLPGHGDHPDALTAAAAIEFSNQELKVSEASIVVGFSLGARLALGLHAANTVAISPPFDSVFSPEARSELLKVLRPRWVREEKPMSGLTETLSKLDLLPESDCSPLFLYAQKDLASVKDSLKSKQDAKCIPHCDHYSILNSKITIQEILNWLDKRVE